jgi:ribosomal-protein-alanine N-acetyltransferase
VGGDPALALRPLGPDDLPAWFALQAEALADPFSYVSLAEELASPRALAVGAFIGAPLAACGLGWLVLDELQILAVATAAAWRRRGLGAAVVRALGAAALARGARTATLEVRAGNAGALALYRGLGFTADGLRRRYYPDGEDAVLMRCALTREQEASR